MISHATAERAGSEAEMIRFMQDVLEGIGPRPSCSAEEQALGDRLAERWATTCDAVEQHRFTCRPAAFMGVFPYAVALYLGGLLFFAWLPPLAFALVATGLALLVLEVVRYREVADGLFPEAEGRNVVGVIRPRGAVRQRVLVSAHLDSAGENLLFHHFGQRSVLLVAGLVLAFTWLTFGSLATSVAWFLGATGHPLFNGILVVGMLLYPVVGLFFFFQAGPPVPGALDDLSGVAVVDGVGRSLAAARTDGGFFPEHTEILLVGMSAEEAGLRGARRFVDRYRSRLEKQPTYAIFLDGIGDERQLTVADREVCPGVRHDEELVQLALDASAEAGLAMRRRPLLLGATDATPFSRARIPAVTLLAQDVGRIVPAYHSRRDTLDRIRSPALTATLQVVLGMIRHLDGRTTRPS